MANLRVLTIDRDGQTTKKRTTQVKGDTTDIELWIDPTYGVIHLVAEIRLNATREILDRVQGKIPEDYYSRFDRYPKGRMRQSLIGVAETGPSCSFEFGFTRALAHVNKRFLSGKNLFAWSTSHLTAKPPGVFRCINRTEAYDHRIGRYQPKKMQGSEPLITYGPTERRSIHGWGGFDFREHNPYGDSRGPLQVLPKVMYTMRVNSARQGKVRIAGDLKRIIEHILEIHANAEELIMDGEAPFGRYWAIGLEGNYSKEEE